MNLIKSLTRKITFPLAPRPLFVFTLLYALLCLYYNFVWLQVFCMPVWWAAVSIIVVFLNILFFLHLQKTWLRPLSHFLLGAGVPVFLYCVLFLANPWSHLAGYLVFIVALVFFGISLPAFFPVFMLRRIYVYFKKNGDGQRAFFWSGVSVPFIIFAVYCAVFNAKYDYLMGQLKGKTRYQQETAMRLPKDFCTERILAIGFKYHTMIEYMYDGARPPLHDPLLNAFLWFKNAGQYNGYFPLSDDMSLDVREQYYHAVFPELPLKASCPCSFNKDGMSYFKRPAAR